MRWFGLKAGVSAALGVLACVLSGAVGAEIATNGARILYFEPMRPLADARTQSQQKLGRAPQLKFDAYGKRFELALELNQSIDRARAALNTASTSKFYRGSVNGAAGSWVRLAKQSERYQGLIFDGRDLYAIESIDSIRGQLVASANVTPTDTVIFRVADTIIEGGAGMCAAQATTESSGADTLKSLSRELTQLKASTVMSKDTASLRLEISAIGDAKFREQFASDDEAIDAMLVRLNNVDGIFSAQVGIEIQVPTTLVYTQATDPLTATTSPSALLDKLAALRQNTSALNSRGLTHLFTGRDLDGTTVGIGFVDSLCSKKYGAALSEVRGRASWLESLIAAHEVGHNFGAVHDGEGQCSSVAPNKFLMSPTVHSTDSSFSDCSRNSILSGTDGASCIVSTPPANLGVGADLGIARGLAGQLIGWQFAVTNQGGRLAQSARVEVTIPAAIDIKEAWTPGGACTTGAGTVACELGDISGGSSRDIHLSMSAAVAGTSSLSARVSSTSDSDPLNNSGTASIVIDSNASFTMGLDAPASITTGAAATVSFTLTNTGTSTSGPVRIEFQVPDFLQVTGATLTRGSCTSAPVVCTVDSLDASAAVSGTLNVVATTPSNGDLSAQVYVDSTQPITSATRSIQALSPRNTESSSTLPTQSSGGGGSMAAGFLLGLTALGALRRRR